LPCEKLIGLQLHHILSTLGDQSLVSVGEETLLVGLTVIVVSAPLGVER
jgi:hypothetical protein